MQTMTQGRDRISLAHRAALAVKEVARQLSLVAVVFSVAALVMGTAGTSYAKKAKGGDPAILLDTIVVSNFGSLFNGSVVVFPVGSTMGSGAATHIIGGNTFLGDENGAAGDSRATFSLDVAVAVPLGIAGLLPNGYVVIFGPTANQNSFPGVLIGSFPGFEFTGLSLSQGVAYADPYASFTGELFDEGLGELLAVSNFAHSPAPDSVVVGPDGAVPGPAEGICAINPEGAFGVGSITEYLSAFLLPLNPQNLEGSVSDEPPFPFPFATPPTVTVENIATGTFTTPNVTIGGCASWLFGPIGLTFDSEGFLYVVNELGKYVTVYAPDAEGDAIPLAIIGLTGDTEGAFIDPQYIAIVNDDGDPDDDVIAVTDIGTSKNISAQGSVKFFEPFEDCPMTPLLPVPPFTCYGEQTASLQGKATKLKRPLGIAADTALDDFDDVFYVANNNKNTLQEYVDFDFFGGTQNVPPTLTLNKKKTFLNFPVGVALSQFTPSPEETGTETFTPTPAPTATATATATDTPTATATATAVPTETIGIQ
jgi:hypothetical protein